MESVRDGQLSYIRHVQLYFMDRDFYDIKHQDLQSSMTILKDKLNDEELLFFHGTTEINAQSIVARGIVLVSRGSRPGDFGFGFYTTNNFFQALQHAEHRARQTVGEQRAACLVFSIPKDVFNAHQIISLSYEEKEEELIEV